jgi:hypothetical protein
MNARAKTLTILFLLMARSAVFAQKPQVQSVSPVKIGDCIGITCSLNDLFAPKIVGTIKSGLPALLNFDMRLHEEAGREVWRGDQSWKILYDLWTEKYRLRTSGEEKFFDNFSGLEEFCRRFQSGPLLSQAYLQRDKKYRVRVQVIVIPISSRQKEQLRDILEASESGQESNPAESRRNSFSVNISQLISFFMSGKSQPDGASEWGESAAFRVAEISP